MAKTKILTSTDIDTIIYYLEEGIRELKNKKLRSELDQIETELLEYSIKAKEDVLIYEGRKKEKNKEQRNKKRKQGGKKQKA